MSETLPTGAYKGTRDFYPKDMAIQRHIFDTWARVAESFGYERYDASVLEPSELYKSKGSENEELVSEQTYTFTDRGDREVTLRPEMTPTTSRMIAAKRRELIFPVRWYSIPNLFRYERPQRGRLREHWQLNCDLFGSTDAAADVEMIALAYHTLRAFGATDEMFVIRINSRTALIAHIERSGIQDPSQMKRVLAVLDKRTKMSAEDFTKVLAETAGSDFKLAESVPKEVEAVVVALASLGIKNVAYDASLVRGFNYYTGVTFEFFDTAEDNPRSLLGGGRYDNLTALFGGEAIPGVGFGMGDVTVRDFLETHNLLPSHVTVTAPKLMVIPTDSSFNIAGEQLAQEFRTRGISASVDIGEKKLGKKISSAGEKGVRYGLIFGETEQASGTYTLKDLAASTETSGTITELIAQIK